MNSAAFHLLIWVGETQAVSIDLEHVTAEEKVDAVIGVVLRRLGREPYLARWRLMYKETILSPDATIGSLLPATIEPVELLLTEVSLPQREPCLETDFEVPALDEEFGTEADALDESDNDLENSELGLSLEGEESSSGVVPLEDVEEPDEGAATVQRIALALCCISKQEPDAVAHLKLETEAAETPPLPTRTAKKAVTRNATVRYYNRMNPDQAYPLLVAITKDAIQTVAQKSLDQRSRTISVAVSAVVEIEPILPGCDCYPPKQSVRIGRGDDKVTFHVVPKVQGVILGARVELRCQSVILTKIPLELRVVSKTPATVLCVSTLFLPFVVAMFKLFNIDFEAHLQVLAGVFLAATGAGYVLARPRQHDAFWDLTPIDMVRFSCPQCQKRLKAPQQGAGRQTHCPRCGQWLLVPKWKPLPPGDLSNQGVSPPLGPIDLVYVETDTFTVNCPGCDRQSRLAFQDLGRAIQCATCDTCFIPTQVVSLPK